ncbi:MAG: bifunctional phosphoribosyl-AMP cyclohydrolase/phosphoribosyl-ATP diphosphatase HisIE [Limnochordia bacterium]|jgi:phosphoribosyl-ATP pyrophosphohydrolase/phosphoribosyl-AMP cyclohydrolase
MITLENLKFDAQGLIPAIIQDHKDGQVLMVAYMNRESLQKTLETGQTWFYSRSRQTLWHKGATSGHYQLVHSITADCDGDCLLIKAEQLGPGACHEGYRSCFHYPLQGEEETSQTFRPGEVYGQPAAILAELYQVILDRKDNPPSGSYTAKLWARGLDQMVKKLGEEAVEVVIAAKNEEREPLVSETADLLYHLLVVLAQRGIDLEEIWAELRSRREGN